MLDFPFDKINNLKVDIRVVLVEFSHIVQKRLMDVMEEARYDHPFDLQEDMVFVKRAT